MADETASGLPYPELPDDNNPPADFRALAEAIDALYGGTVANVAALPALPAFKGQRIYVQDVDAIAWYDDKTAAWQGFARDYVPGTAGTVAPTVTGTTYTITPDEMVEIDFKILLTAIITATLTMDLPAGITFHANEDVVKYLGGALLRDTSAAARQFGYVVPLDADSVAFLYNATAATAGVVSTGTTPWTWAAADTVSGKIRFRRA